MGKLGNFVARVACVAGAVVVVVFKAKGEISNTRAHTRKEKARSRSSAAPAT